jgi:hypothetical protein
VPGAFFAEDFGTAIYNRLVGFSDIPVKNNAIFLQLKLINFVSVFRVFDEKIQAAAQGTFHNKKVLI